MAVWKVEKETVTFIAPTHRPSDAHVCFLFLHILKKPGHADWESLFLLQRKPKVRKRLWEGKPSFHCGRPTFTRSQNPQRGKWHKIWKPGLKLSTESGFRWTQKWDYWNGSKYRYSETLKCFYVFLHILLHTLWDSTTYTENTLAHFEESHRIMYLLLLLWGTTCFIKVPTVWQFSLWIVSSGEVYMRMSDEHCRSGDQRKVSAPGPL